ncbi:unnamed protein product, partial [Closterium sp. NIES-53]
MIRDGRLAAAVAAAKAAAAEKEAAAERAAAAAERTGPVGEERAAIASETTAQIPTGATAAADFTVSAEATGVVRDGRLAAAVAAAKAAAAAAEGSAAGGAANEPVQGGLRVTAAADSLNSAGAGGVIRDGRLVAAVPSDGRLAAAVASAKAAAEMERAVKEAAERIGDPNAAAGTTASGGALTPLTSQGAESRANIGQKRAVAGEGRTASLTRLEAKRYSGREGERGVERGGEGRRRTRSNVSLMDTGVLRLEEEVERELARQEKLVELIAVAGADMPTLPVQEEQDRAERQLHRDVHHWGDEVAQTRKLLLELTVERVNLERALEQVHWAVGSPGAVRAVHTAQMQLLQLTAQREVLKELIQNERKENEKVEEFLDQILSDPALDTTSPGFASLIKDLIHTLNTSPPVLPAATAAIGAASAAAFAAFAAASAAAGSAGGGGMGGVGRGGGGGGGDLHSASVGPSGGSRASILGHSYSNLSSSTQVHRLKDLIKDVTDPKGTREGGRRRRGGSGSWEEIGKRLEAEEGGGGGKSGGGGGGRGGGRGGESMGTLDWQGRTGVEEDEVGHLTGGSDGNAVGGAGKGGGGGAGGGGKSRLKVLHKLKKKVSSAGVGAWGGGAGGAAGGGGGGGGGGDEVGDGEEGYFPGGGMGSPRGGEGGGAAWGGIPGAHRRIGSGGDTDSVSGIGYSAGVGAGGAVGGAAGGAGNSSGHPAGASSAKPLSRGMSPFRNLGRYLSSTEADLRSLADGAVAKGGGKMVRGRRVSDVPLQSDRDSSISSTHSRKKAPSYPGRGEVEDDKEGGMRRGEGRDGRGGREGELAEDDDDSLPPQAIRSATQPTLKRSLARRASDTRQDLNNLDFPVAGPPDLPPLAAAEISSGASG